MDLTMFENFNTHRISLNEAKRILNKNGNRYSEEDVKRILDYLHAVAELAAEHAEHQTESVQLIFRGNDPSSQEQLQEVAGGSHTKVDGI